MFWFIIINLSIGVSNYVFFSILMLFFYNDKSFKEHFLKKRNLSEEEYHKVMKKSNPIILIPCFVPLLNVLFLIFLIFSIVNIEKVIKCLVEDKE